MLFLALALSVYSGASSLLGARYIRPRLVESGMHATYLLPIILLIAVLALVTAFITHGFDIAYVAEHSNRAMPSQYTWVAFYSGNEGSLLYIAFSLSAIGALALYKSPAAMKEAVPYINIVVMIVLMFFLAIMAFLANPFTTTQIVPEDGQGINPLLTHPGMFIHPPIMMLGLIAVTIPFAFATGALLANRTEDQWVDAGRTWALVAWALLGLGLLLGGWWAYTILGWGGYWGWDPVENSGLMPFLGLTAFVHSIMVQKRRGMFRMWNIALINITFLLACFGMFINRGGPVPSIHSFGQSALGWTFLIFMGVMALLSFALFFYRYDRLKSARGLESTLSREAAFLVNNLLLLFIAFVTMWGVIFPIISQLVDGTTVTVAAPFYNRVAGPVFLALIFLMGVAPLIPWRRSTIKGMGKAILLPVIFAIATASILYMGGIRNPYPLLSFSLCSFVAIGILREWYRGTRTLHKRGLIYPVSFLRLISANRPRYGGYIVHLAVIVLALGVTGSSFFDIRRDVIMSPGDITTVGDIEVKFHGATIEMEEDRIERTALLEGIKDGNSLGTMKATYNFYPSFRMASTRAALRSTPIEDLYIIPQEFFEDGSVAFRIFLNPLVWWIWISGPILILGTLISLWPSRREKTLTSEGNNLPESSQLR
jgi:cytochrome c-type biogenesis protein CcmF